jgi:transaldolase
MAQSKTRLHRLRDHGQSAWVDYLSRDLIRTGELAALVRDGVTGVTSNPTILQGAIADSDAYDAQLTVLANEDIDPKDAFLTLARDDIRAACDELRPSWDHGAGRDGWVSLEVDPHLAYDAEATIAEATRLHAMVERPNLFVKIPATEPGLLAIEETIAREIPVNVTLCFSIERHRAVCDAYLRGLRRLREQGGDLRRVASVASFFVSRVDTEADRRLDELGGHAELRGTLAIANAKLAYRTYQEVFAGEEWTELAREGASSQRCLWASTSTKDPAYGDVRYVEQLIGPETVNTMPRETIAAFLDHGEVGNTLTADVDAARRTLEAFAAAGIDYDDVTATLERDGVKRFAESFDRLFDDVERKRRALVAT